MSTQEIDPHTQDLMLAPGQPKELLPLAHFLAENIERKQDMLAEQGKEYYVNGPDWCRANPYEAGQQHADLIKRVYGETYALPNKDPGLNARAIMDGNLDMYLMYIDGQPTATTCLVDTRDGRGELGRSVSEGKAGASIILDMRILDWLTNPATAERFHTLFTTLRTAPDRLVDGIPMRGGQGVSHHWSQFPNLRVHGIAPLYFKHGALEQFTCATITRNEVDATRPLFVADQNHAQFIGAWHDQYGLAQPPINTIESNPYDQHVSFIAHYPPQESGLTNLVHADVVVAPERSGKSLPLSLLDAHLAGSPFTQVMIPIDRDTRVAQADLTARGYQVFGYQPADAANAATLLFGKVRPGTAIIPTFWEREYTPHPFWSSPELQAQAREVTQDW